MSSVRDAKLESLSSTLVKRCRLSDSHLGHRNNQWLQSSTSSFLSHYTISLLGVYPSICLFQSGKEPFHLSASSEWVFSLTFQHLPSKPFTYREFKMQSLGCCLGPQPNLSPHTCTPHSSTFPWVVPLKPQTEWPSYSHANERLQNKFSMCPPLVKVLHMCYVARCNVNTSCQPYLHYAERGWNRFD